MMQFIYLPKYLLGKLIYLISGLISAFGMRNTSKAVFGCYKNKFSDNSKYLYLHWHNTKFKRVIWISGDKALITRLQQQGMEAYYRWSKEGVWHSLSAKYYFYCSYIGDINQYLAMGAYKVNLWHGLPLKKIEFDIDNGPMAHIYQTTNAGNGLESSLVGACNNLWRQLRYHQQYIKPDLMLSPSPLIDKLFSSAFRLEEHQLLRSGNPRTDYFHLYPNEKSTTVKDPDGRPVELNQFNRVILYAPSWRDTLMPTQAASNEFTNNNPYQAAIDWQTLSAKLTSTNSLLLVRFHPNEAHIREWLKQHSNIIDISCRDDVYDLLSSVDLLVTDYSSLFIDALTHDIPMVFFQFDKQEYQSQCRGNYAYASNLELPGKLIYHSDELIKAIFEHSPSIRHQACYSYAKKTYWDTGLINAFAALEKSMQRLNNMTTPDFETDTNDQ